MKNRRITAFIFNLSKGGAQGVFTTVMNHFFEIGWQIDVVVQNLDDDIYREKLNKGISVYSLETKNAKDSLIALIKYIKNKDIQCAWVFGPEMAINVYIAKRINNKKFSIIGRSINTLSSEFQYTDSFFRKYVTHYLIKVFFHKLTYVIAQSENMGNDLIKNYNFTLDQVRVINNALAPNFEKELSNKTEMNRDNFLLYVGRFEKQKGLDMLIKAFSEMNNKNVELVLLGEGSDKGRLCKLVEELRMNTRIKFVGYTMNPIEYYKKASAVVLSSYFEGFPNVLIESLSCGTPVVSFDLPSGPNEIIIEDLNGYLVDYCDINKLSIAMDKAITKKWDYSRIKLTAKKYSSSYILKKYETLLRESMQNMEV